MFLAFPVKDRVGLCQRFFTGVSPIESTMIMLEETLQSVDVSDCFRLSLVLASKNDSFHVDATVLSNVFLHIPTPAVSD
jgi:hypothetical protein